MSTDGHINSQAKLPICSTRRRRSSTWQNGLGTFQNIPTVVVHGCEIIDDIECWRKAGQSVAIARVVALDGSGHRDPGATMAVSQDGEIAGSISGGCVEGAVVTEALAAIEDGEVRRCSFGYSDDEAFAVGLSCGGTIHVLIDPRLPTVYDDLRRALTADQPVALRRRLSSSMHCQRRKE